MQESKELDIFDLIATLWRHKIFIVKITAGVALSALLVSLLLPKTYLSTAQVLVVRPMASTDAMGRAHEVPFRTFEYVIKNWENFVRTIEQMNLRVGDKPMLPEELDSLVKVRSLPDVDILQIDVWMPDPQTAQKVNRTLLDLSLKRYQDVSLAEGQEAASQLETMARQAEEEFKKYNTRLRDFLVGAHLKQIEGHLEVLAHAMKEATGRLEMSVAMKEFEQAQVARFQRTLSETAPNLELESRFRIAPELASTFLGKPLQADAQVLFGQQIQNPTFVRSDTDLVVSQAELSGYEAEVQGLEKRMAQLKDEFTATETLFHERSAERRALESDLTARQTAYETLYKQRADAAMNFTTRSYTLRVLSSPSISEKKASPRITLNVLAGVFLGFLVAAVWVLAASYRDRRDA
jgi:uncharacterized protein involved in exopolysaccharide biosynthesis